MNLWEINELLSVAFTGEDDVLDVLAGVVCDANGNFDGLTVIVNLKQDTGSEDVSMCQDYSWNWSKLVEKGEKITETNNENPPNPSW